MTDFYEFAKSRGFEVLKSADELDHLEEPKGLYLQLREDGALYAGQTSDLRQRYDQHVTKGKVSICAIAVKVLPGISRQEREELETRLIADCLDAGFALANRAKLAMPDESLLDLGDLGSVLVRETGPSGRIAKALNKKPAREELEVLVEPSKIAAIATLCWFARCVLPAKVIALYGKRWTVALEEERVLLVAGRHVLLTACIGEGTFEVRLPQRIMARAGFDTADSLRAAAGGVFGCEGMLLEVTEELQTPFAKGGDLAVWHVFDEPGPMLCLRLDAAALRSLMHVERFVGCASAVALAAAGAAHVRHAGIVPYALLF